MNEQHETKRRIKVYLAARYSRRLELCGYRNELKAAGYNVCARWLDGEHQLATDGTPIGEDGAALVEGTLRPGEFVSEHELTARAAALRTKFALDDLEDVSTANVVISFTEPPRSTANRGGRHVEFGIALIKAQVVVVVGHRENIFHWLPNVNFFERWTDALKWLESWPRHIPQ